MRFGNNSGELFPGVGEYGIPSIEAREYPEPREWINFGAAASVDPRKRASFGVHFFVDDYKFERVWNDPETYVSLLSDFAVVTSPDFSLYRDYPLALQIWNHYRKHWCGAYWQSRGVRVIPTIAWSDTASFSWCFDGEPTGGVIATSSLGCLARKDREARENFLAGYREMVRRLRPTKVIFYGAIPEECKAAEMPPAERVPAFYEKFEKMRQSEV